MGSSRRRATALLVALAMVVMAAGCDAERDAEASAPKRIGILRLVADDDHAAFVDELRTQGYVVGRDIVIEPAEGEVVQPDLEAASATLEGWLRDGIDLVVAFSTPYARLAIEVDPPVPILFVVNDPLASGLITDPDAPEGGATGVTFRVPADRTLDLAARVLGDVDTVGYLAPAEDPALPGHRAAAKRAAQELGLRWVEATYRDAADLPLVAEQLDAAGVDVVYPTSSNTTYGLLAEIEAALDRHDLPAVGNTDLMAFAVVVISPEGPELRRQLARQAARVLGGATVAEVPVEDPRKFTVILNRTKLEAFGVTELDPAVVREADVVR